MTRPMFRAIAALAAALTMGGAQALASTAGGEAPPNTREVILVGNNWAGTADVLRPAWRLPAGSPGSTSSRTRRSG